MERGDRVDWQGVAAVVLLEVDADSVCIGIGDDVAHVVKKSELTDIRKTTIPTESVSAYRGRNRSEATQ